MHREVGFGFLFAQAHHPAMRHVGPVRRELGIRTVFNLLGPLTNPAGARRQVVGVYAESLVEPIAQVLAKLGAEHAMVVHGAGGLDELTPTGENLVSEVRGGEVRTYTLDRGRCSTGPGPGSPDDLRCGGDPAQNAAVILTVFDGERGPRRDAVILNAAAALVVGGVVAEMEPGIDLAVETIDSGAAAAKLEGLVAFTRDRAPGRDERLPRPPPRRHPPGRARAGPRFRRRARGRAAHRRDRRDQAGVAVAGRDRAGRGRGRDGRAVRRRRRPAMSVLCAERDFGGSLDDLSGPPRRSCRPSRRTSPSSPSRSRAAAGRVPTRSWSSSRC